jgi:hypothetical protein
MVQIFPSNSPRVALQIEQRIGAIRIPVTNMPWKTDY